MAQCRHTLPTAFAVLPMSTVIVTSALPTLSLVIPSTRHATLGDRACSQSME